LSNKREDKFFAHNIIIHIEKNINENFSFGLIINGFNNLKIQKNRYMQFLL